jgi:hypothetical protein
MVNCASTQNINTKIMKSCALSSVIRSGCCTCPAADVFRRFGTAAQPQFGAASNAELQDHSMHLNLPPGSSHFAGLHNLLSYY